MKKFIYATMLILSITEAYGIEKSRKLQTLGSYITRPITGMMHKTRQLWGSPPEIPTITGKTINQLLSQQSSLERAHTTYVRIRALMLGGISWALMHRVKTIALIQKFLSRQSNTLAPYIIGCIGYFITGKVMNSRSTCRNRRILFTQLRKVRNTLLTNSRTKIFNILTGDTPLTRDIIQQELPADADNHTSDIKHTLLDPILHQLQQEELT
jgi:hypothetical protein